MDDLCMDLECTVHRLRHAKANRTLAALGWFSCDTPACACGGWHESAHSDRNHLLRVNAALRACLLAVSPHHGMLTDDDLITSFLP